MPEPKINIGAWIGPFEGRVDADAALAYARATDDPNQVYEDGTAVPLLYTVSLIFDAYLQSVREGIEPGAVAGARGGVHAEHDLRLHRPLKPGAAVTWKATTSGAQQTKAGALVAQHLVVSDDEGPVVEHYWTTLHMGGTIAGPLGEELVDHTFPEEARARAIGTHSFHVARDQAFRYGGASGDRSIMHLDDVAAVRAGFPSKFMQGMCSFAMCTGAVVKLAAGGDPDRVRRMACRFSAPMFPGNDLDVTVYDAPEVSIEGSHAVAFEAIANDVAIIKHGRADIAD